LYTNAGGAAATEKLRIKEDGNVDIKDGNLIIGTAGHGIDFSAAADVATGETVASSVLDDYEEGSFTPTVTASSSVGTITYQNQHGHYTKIGQMVCCWIMIRFTESGSSGDMKIQGLPFTNSDVTGYYAIGTFQCNDMEDSYAANVGQYTPYLAPASSDITMRGTMSNGDAVSVMQIQGMGYLRIQINYRV
jgi:hypothetical protein